MSGGYLLDTNIISELRKGSRTNEKVVAWFDGIDHDSVWLSVLVLGEIRQGIERLRRKDPVASGHLETWLEGLYHLYKDKILPVSAEIADRWGIMNASNPVTYIDGFLAATALEHKLVLVTRNTADIKSTSVSYLNPFE